MNPDSPGLKWESGNSVHWVESNVFSTTKSNYHLSCASEGESFSTKRKHDKPPRHMYTHTHTQQIIRPSNLREYLIKISPQCFGWPKSLKKEKKRCKYQRSLLQDTTNISASSQVAVCLSMHVQGRNPVWSLKMTGTILPQTRLFDQWTKLSVRHSGEGEIWRQVWWANGGIVGGKLPVGPGQVEWVEVHDTALLYESRGVWVSANNLWPKWLSFLWMRFSFSG